MLFGTSAFAGAGLIDLKIVNSNLNAARTQWTFDVQMKRGTGYQEGWRDVEVFIDVEYGSFTGTAPTATASQTQVTTLVSTPVTTTNAFPSSRAASAENTIEVAFSNIQANGSYILLPTAWTTYTSVTVNFSSAIGPSATTVGGAGSSLTVRSTSNPPPGAAANQIDFRSFWTDEVADQREFNSLNPAGAPLPVKLLTFAATKAGVSRSFISWVTASEEAASYFEVERSFTGGENSFRSIGVKVPATGNSKIEVAYQAYDEQPATGANYYRLKMVDISGAVSYSSTRIVHFDNRGGSESVMLFPNPIRIEGADVKLKVDVLSAQTLDYTLSSVTGQLIYAGKLEVATGTNNYKVAGFESIAPGTYYLRVKGTKLSNNIKVLKMD